MSDSQDIQFIPASEAAEISRNLEQKRKLDDERKNREEYNNAIKSFNDNVKNNVGKFDLPLYGRIWTVEKLAQFENSIRRAGYNATCRQPKYEYDEYARCDVNWNFRKPEEDFFKNLK